MINEIAQWAVLVFLGVFVVGLTRQLGQFMVAPREQQALDEGPRLGKRLPSRFLLPEEAQKLAEAKRDGAPQWMLALAVDEDCEGCESMLKWLKRNGSPSGAAILAISRKSGPRHAALLDGLAAVTIVDEGRFAELGLRTTPFVIVLDGEMRVVHKQITADVPDAIARWRSRSRKEVDIDSGNGAAAPAENHNGAEMPSVVQHGGGSR
ncbi:MAG: hypothetical protein QOH76_3192 [Thermoleophilaceae bacterium]|jgi:hypothetical protein|nr:hypothetical protein [Thermoleophilaceae bacterium]